MKQGQRAWTREELILVVNLYLKLPFGRLHKLNPEVVELASLLNRTTNSIALKLVNFASLDPSIKARGFSGMKNASKLDVQVWHEFFDNWESLPFESEELLAKHRHTTVEELNHISEEELPKEGIDRERIVKTRVNQSLFRSSILAAYNNTCCITGINKPELLVAGHIRPWGIDEKNRLNPRNGLAINALHDRAFESGLLTVTPDYRVHISSALLKQKDEFIKEYFGRYDNQPIILPSRFLPDIKFLEYHNKERFIA